MNIEELKAKALAEFDVWPYDVEFMVTPREENVISSNKVGDMYQDHEPCFNVCWQQVYTREEFEADKAKQSKVYWDGEEEFKVGMIVDCPLDLENTQYIQGEVAHIGQSFGEIRYIIQCQNWITVHNKNDLKPTDNRTDKEKAIDLIIEDLSVVDKNTRKTLEFAYDKWEVSL